MDIRKILDIVTEAEQPLAKGMKVMSLAQFLQQSGVEPPKGEEETVNELSPQTKKSYSIAAKDDKKFNDNSIDKAMRMSQEQPHKKAEWEDEIEFLKSVNAKRDRGLARAGVAEGHADQQRKVFKKNGKPVGEVGIDRESSPGVGQWYMKCYAYDIDYSGYDSYEEAVAELKHCLKQGVAEGLSKQAKAKKEAEAVMAAIKRLEAELKNPNKHVDKADIQKRLDTEKRRLELYRDVLDEQGVAEGAPELLKKEMPTHRHAEKLLAQNGVNKDDPDYQKHLANTIKHLRKFGNIDLINKQDVKEGTVTPIKSYLVMASRPGRGMYTDQDVLIKDTGTGKIVGHVTGRDAHPNMNNEMDIAHYELTLNKDGIGPDLKNGFEFEAYGDPNLPTKSGYKVFATDNSGKNRPQQKPKPKPRTDVGQKVVQLRPEQPKKPQGLSVFSQGNLEKAAQTAQDDDRDYGPGMEMELVSNVDWYTFLEKFFGKQLLDTDSAIEMGYTDWTDNGDIAFTSGEGTPNKKVDEAEKLGGVSARKLPPEEMRAYLDRITKKEKEKTDKYKLPYIHSSNIPIVNDDGQKYDLQKLAAAFSERPTKILKQNEKMQHSDGTSSQFYNVGLPALKGLAVDEDTGEFVVIDTCPGAGSCKLVCYAMKGGYVQWKASSLGQTKLLNFLYNDPDGFMSMLESEIAGYEAKNKKKNIKTIIRWHDAGDFFSPQYLEKAFDLAKKFPDVDFYAYTKLAGVAQGEKPDNFKINFSAGAQPSQEKKIDFQQTKNSRIVPKELFADALEKDESGKWQYTSPQAQQAVKDRMAIKYSLDPKSVITYDEMMKIPVDKSPEAKGKWNVIVKPGDGDDAANRNDVLSSLLLIH